VKNAKNVGEALSRVHALVESRNGIHILHTSEISRQDRELLIHSGWLQEIIQAWYLLVRPDMRAGDSSGWYANFWNFLSIYLPHFFEDHYCLSAESSLSLHLGITTIPKQIIIMAKKGRGTPIELPFDISMLIYASKELEFSEKEQLNGLQVMSLAYALCKVSPIFFKHHPLEVEIALQAIKDGDELLQVIAKHKFLRAAGRLVGAYRFLKNDKMVAHLLKGLKSIHFKIQETNPFIDQKPLLTALDNQTPYAARITAMWRKYRQEVINHFPTPPGLAKSPSNYLKQVEEKYTQDAYHSLSIEGYRVNEKLIESVKNSQWNPEVNGADRDLINALTARGYYEAFQNMKISLNKVFSGGSAGAIIEEDLQDWYRALFAPSVKAGLISPSDLFGYRKEQVYIRNSRHTPFPTHALFDAMNAFFQCLKNEEHAGVRAVLGHFIFVFIHPYMDGNGRLGRLLMNTMLASGGYPWKIVHLEHRDQYLDCLEAASVEGNIVPFVQFLASEI